MSKHLTTRVDVYGEKQFLFLTLISKIVDRGYINFEHIEKSTMICLSFALLFGDNLSIKGAVSITTKICDPAPFTRHLQMNE